MNALPDGWFEVSVTEARGFEAELKKEMSPAHPLSGLEAQCVARRKDRDDFLFRFPGAQRPLAVVHLTWHVEKSADFPWTTFFDSDDDFEVNWRRIFD